MSTRRESSEAVGAQKLYARRFTPEFPKQKTAMECRRGLAESAGMGSHLVDQVIALLTAEKVLE